jgi:type VI secretion system protein ImpA
MSRLEELLAPIEGDTPAGPELRSSNEFAAIERAFLDADQPALMSPSGVDEEGGEEFELVVELATDFLQHQSKDLKVAVLLAVSLLRVEGFPGLADGLEVIKGLLEGYWDNLHPGIPSRGPTLDWMGSDDVSYALYLVPLTEFGHRYNDYKEWAKDPDAGKGGAGKDDEGDGGDFRSAFAQTPRGWYEDLCGALHRCNAALDDLDALGKERFADAGEKPPRYASFADALKRVTGAAEDLLGRKPAPPKPRAEAAPSAGGAEVTAPGGTVPAAPPGPEPTVSPAAGGAAFSEPRSAEEAATLIAAAARTLRKERPGDPSGYLLLRALRWGEIRAGGDHVDPRLLEAPDTGQRTRLKSLFLDKKYEDLLESAEEIMATPAGRGWLDLQRYAVLAADKLGGSHRQVGLAIRSALASLLRDLPSLLDASLMDDSPTASRDTMTWLEGEGLLQGREDEAGRAERSRAAEADRIIREAGFDRAAAMARAGDPEGAVKMLIERAEHEGSERARFIAKAEAAGIMVEYDMAPVARPILDELVELIEKHRLEEWEPADMVARPLGLLIRCLDPQREGQLRQKLYPRLAKLAPLLAMEVNRKAVQGSAGESAQPAPQPPSPQESKPAAKGPTPMPITPVDPGQGD